MEVEDCENVEMNNEGNEENNSHTSNKKKKGKKKKTFLPGQPLREGEQLVCDESAYVMHHEANAGSPCLSFDIIPDHLGDNREVHPLSAYIVAGTQSDSPNMNKVLVMKMYNLHKTHEKEKEDDDEDSDDDNEDSDVDEEPCLQNALFKHSGCVNRIRVTTHLDAVLAATWSELGRVHIWNLIEPLQAVDSKAEMKKFNAQKLFNPVFTFSGHQTEGFAMDWCPTKPGVLATGDCKKDIHVWNPHEDGTWNVDQRPLVGHTKSVEDLQWSPNERNVLASCSVDKSIRIWDVRATPNKACMLTTDSAHESDVNVISWNKNEPFIVSGGDDGVLHVWDLRQFQTGTPVSTFKHHTQPVTTVEWHPTEASIFASGGSDDQIALWDLAVERDDDDCDVRLKDLPPQLLFIHQGQTEVKELHWHPQLPGVIISTALSGFNIFRTISV